MTFERLTDQLEQEVAADEIALQQKRSVLAWLHERGGGNKKPGRVRVQPGSLPDRVLAILGEGGEPMTFTAIAKDAGAKPFSTRTALLELVKNKRVTRTGAGRGTRYGLR